MKLSEKKQSVLIRDLSFAIVSLQDTAEAKKFLRDLLTKQELIEFANRWKTAQMLSINIPYSEIKKETGLSSTTIARVSKWLAHGTGGYKTMLTRLAHNRKSSIMKNLPEKD